VIEPDRRKGMPSEFELIRRHFARPTPGAVLGPGDDCALLAPSAGMELAITTDMLVEATHFLSTVSPRLLGWKTVAVNLSDLAAMGAQPRWILLAGSLPGAMTVAESLALALRYSQDVVDMQDDEREMEHALALCGLSPQRTYLTPFATATHRAR
jgi:thiamine-monophosphate kinase